VEGAEVVGVGIADAGWLYKAKTGVKINRSDKKKERKKVRIEKIKIDEKVCSTILRTDNRKEKACDTFVTFVDCV
jgi:hypothetical protein